MPAANGTHFWVQSYDCYNRLSVRTFDERDEAFAEFEQRIAREKTSPLKGAYYFVQMGAWTPEGSIVLNEWRTEAAQEIA